MLKQLAIATALCCGVAHGQTPNAFPVDFPDGAQPPSAAQLTEQLGGQVFTTAKLSDGVTWRIEYKSSGYLFFDVSTGHRDSATWRTEDGRVCMEFRRSPSGCTEFRMSANTLYLKRVSTGEVVALLKQ